MILWAVLIFSFYGGANFYIASRLYQGLSHFFSNINIVIFICIYTFFALSIFIRFIPVPYGIRRFIDTIGSYWMGIFLYLLIFFVIADIVILLGNITALFPGPIPQSIRFWSFLIVILLTAGVMIFGKYNAANIQHVSYEVSIKNNSLSEEIKIVLIADIHLGVSDGERNLPVIIREINKLEADIVCIAGDIFNDDFFLIRNSSAVMESFRSIESKYGVYACLGNHDGGSTFNEMVNFLEQSNIKLLNDEYVIIANQLVLAGRLDSRPIGGFDDLKRADITETINTKLPVVVMDHDPSHIKDYGHEYDLVLFGHTHGGQIFPVNLLTKSMFIVDYGYYRKDPTSPHMIITSGVSTWGMPIRIGTKNEIVSIILPLCS